MTREQAEALLARRQAAFDRLDAAALAADHAPDCVIQSPAAGTVEGRDAIGEIYGAWFKAFPDLKFRHTEFLLDGDRMALLATVSGTNVSGFMGLPATGRKFQFLVVCVYTFKEDMIVHERRVYDFSGMLIQGGMLKAKPA